MWPRITRSPLHAKSRERSCLTLNIYTVQIIHTGMYGDLSVPAFQLNKPIIAHLGFPLQKDNSAVLNKNGMWIVRYYEPYLEPSVAKKKKQKQKQINETPQLSSGNGSWRKTRNISSGHFSAVSRGGEVKRLGACADSAESCLSTKTRTLCFN